MWSFGSGGRSYLFGENIEEYKRQIHQFIVFGEWEEELENFNCPELKNIKGYTIKERRLEFRKILRQIKNKRIDFQQLEQLERLKQLQQLERLQRLERLERLEMTTMCYTNYEYQEGDIVYCDIPYENTSKYHKDGFNHQEFYKWCKTRDYPVYISSYEIKDEAFKEIWKKEKKVLMCATDNRQTKIERLYKVGD